MRNLRIDQITPLLSPEMVMHTMPATTQTIDFVAQSRTTLSQIIHGQNPRLLVVVGPCSIHDENAAVEYAERLKKLADDLGDTLFIVMRVYFEKPRTTVGWKGLINDPRLDESFAINEGLLLARKILLTINDLQLPAATEFVDTITPQYLADLVSWTAIGARTTESQPHRMLASGLSMPVGFKNNTAGSLCSAVNAVASAISPHRFLSVTEQGMGAIVVTSGNDDAHIVLRGGDQGPNYHASDVTQAVDLLHAKSLSPRVVIDCSHDNSNKDFKKQAQVIHSVALQLQQPNHGILGVMIESHLKEGKQPLSARDELTYGQSITDGCMGWNETETLLRSLAETCAKAAQSRSVLAAS